MDGILAGSFMESQVHSLFFTKQEWKPTSFTAHFKSSGHLPTWWKERCTSGIFLHHSLWGGMDMGIRPCRVRLGQGMAEDQGLTLLHPLLLQEAALAAPALFTLYIHFSGPVLGPDCPHFKQPAIQLGLHIPAAGVGGWRCWKQPALWSVVNSALNEGCRSSPRHISHFENVLRDWIISQ